jgi:dsRNA-specific ribonuclease
VTSEQGPAIGAAVAADPVAELSRALGYEFRDHDQLLTALSHASYAHETRGDRATSGSSSSATPCSTSW